jgi:biopolymer transport protein ExbD
MIKFHRPGKINPHIDIMPLIDIVFLLLIFFLIGSTFIKPVLDMQLPGADSKDKVPPKTIVISIDNNQQMYLNKVKINSSRLLSHLKTIKQQNPEITVVFRADKEVHYYLFVDVMDALKKLKIQNISLEHL